MKSKLTPYFYSKRVIVTIIIIVVIYKVPLTGTRWRRTKI